MHHSEFEEREYEAPLYVQLQHSCTHVWSPGQVLEAHVGFDHALLTSHPYFWRLQGFAAPPMGVVLAAYPFDHWWPRRPMRRSLPDFALNLFIQAKRPMIGSRATKALKLAGIKGPYWKFLVSPHQQSVLESLAKSTAGAALVTYACAAFDRATQLWAHSRAGSIVEASTFPPATSLHGHEAWYYTEPGCTGVANPTLERIEGEPIVERIRRFTSKLPDEQRDNVSFGENLKQLATSIRESLNEEVVGDSGRTAMYFEAVREIAQFIDVARPAEHAETLRSYLEVASFTTIFGMHWHVLARSDA